MAEDRIDSIILLAAIEKEFATVTGYLTKLKTDLASIPPLKTVIVMPMLHGILQQVQKNLLQRKGM